MTRQDRVDRCGGVAVSCGELATRRLTSREKSFPKTASLNVVSRSPKGIPDVVLQKVWAGCPIEPVAYRDSFARRFSKLCRAVFANWRQLAEFLLTDDRTARNYWAGLHKPTGDKVALMALAFPDAFRQHCGAGAGVEADQ